MQSMDDCFGSHNSASIVISALHIPNNHPQNLSCQLDIQTTSKPTDPLLFLPLRQVCLLMICQRSLKTTRRMSPTADSVCGKRLNPAYCAEKKKKSAGPGLVSSPSHHKHFP
ncbi:hypothetical protein FQA47_010084 [Oryzias melastigma]|uniref:Uncharacterized protein n=1 Tax=Oryzias melastigma TaxID=30732 RepID=A0A834FHR5_ORYME|nr:hypothetical protein FQA47_010084 [Oryzias melastigma]